MGCSSSSIIPIDDCYDSEKTLTGQLVKSSSFVHTPTQQEAYEKYTADGTLNIGCKPSEIEFRALLDYPVAREYILAAVKKTSPKLEAYLLGWLELRLYDKLIDGELKQEKGNDIYQKYLCESNPSVTKDTLKTQIKTETHDDGFTSHVFSEVQTHFFRQLHDGVYVAFKKTEEFHKMTKALRRRYNRVKISGFDYLSFLGRGSFGIVCKVRRRTTGVLYAMKLQRKEELASMFGDNELWHVNFEKQAFASLHHPFIVELVYALQTKSLAILVMSLGSGVDLSRVLRKVGRLSPEQVLFYSAEITSALSYLHHMGFIYRDLKPGNVLLNEDGHIQLVDFGAVCDTNGKTLAVCSQAAALAPVFAQEREAEEDLLPLSQFWEGTKTEATIIGQSNNNSNTGSPHPSGYEHQSLDSTAMQPHAWTFDSPVDTHYECAANNSKHQPALPKEQPSPVCESYRAKSLAGTNGYMAPEMVKMMLVDTGCWSTEGYTKAVDWWSLGVTMYKLLMDDYPFAIDKKEFALEMGTNTRQDMAWDRYVVLLEKVDYSSLGVHPQLVDFLSQLLCIEESRRLGYGPQGSGDVSAHPYFDSIDWVMLEQKQLRPPALPQGLNFSGQSDARFLSLSHMMNQVGCGSWLTLGGGLESDVEKKAVPSPSPQDSLADLKLELKKITDDRIKRLQEPFEHWDYISPAAVVLELEHH